MKGIILAVAAVVLSAVNASAYSHSYKNNGSKPVRFWVNYKHCSNDTWPEVKPGETITWRSGLCCISEVAVGGIRAYGDPRGAASATFDDFLKMQGLEGIICKNTNWESSGAEPKRL